MARQQRKRIVLIGVAAGISVAGFVLALVASNRAGGGSNATPALTQVVGAASALDASTKLTNDNLRFISLPSTEVNWATYFNSKAQVLGQYLAVKLPAGAPILSTTLVATANPGAVVHNVPLDIKAGDVALSIPFDETKGVGGYVQPEDHLDILISVNGGIQYGIQDVRILRVGSQSQALTVPAPVASVLVVEVPRDQAAVLTFLASSSTSAADAIVKYTLRPHDAYGTGTIKGPDINAGNWSQFLAR